MRANILAIASVFTLAMGVAAPAQADDVRLRPIRDKLVAEECSACHMLYPAGLLPARSWNELLTGLSDHFGENAELDIALAQRISNYLTANSADKGSRRNRRILRGLPKAATPIRITELPWWRRKHEKKGRVSQRTLKRKGAASKGDCVACHKQAERGYFDDD